MSLNRGKTWTLESLETKLSSCANHSNIGNCYQTLTLSFRMFFMLISILIPSKDIVRLLYQQSVFGLSIIDAHLLKDLITGPEDQPTNVTKSDQSHVGDSKYCERASRRLLFGHSEPIQLSDLNPDSWHLLPTGICHGHPGNYRYESPPEPRD
jgi:hypothetical protein